MTFQLEIKMGNEAMETMHDVAAALREVASKITQGRFDTAFDGVSKGTIYDANGARVGQWSCTGQRSKETA